MDTIVLVDDNGASYPLVSNAEEESYAVGGNWVAGDGVDVVDYGRPYITVVGDGYDVVNPGLVTWLLSYGANFIDTYNYLPLTGHTGSVITEIDYLVCFRDYGRSSVLAVHGDADFAISPQSAGAGKIYDCQMVLVPWNSQLDGIALCDINAANRQAVEYLNAQICVALGMNPIYLT